MLQLVGSEEISVNKNGSISCEQPPGLGRTQGWGLWADIEEGAQLEVSS